MAEVSLTPQQTKSEGIEPTFLSSVTTPALSAGDFAGSGDQMVVPNDGKTVLYVKNGHASNAIEIVVQTPLTQDGLALTDRTVSVDGGDEKAMGPFPRSVYGDPLTFAIDVGSAAITDVTIAVLKI